MTPNSGSHLAVFSFNVLLQKCYDHCKDIIACFLDYEKAVDRVKHTRLIEFLQQVGVDKKDVRIIKNFFWEQIAEIRFENNIILRI